MIEKIPDAINPKIILCECLIVLGKVDEGKKLVEEIKNTNGNNPEVYYLIGLSELY